MPSQLTKNQAEKAVAWFRKAMKLQDWEFTTWLDALPPDWVLPEEADAYGRSSWLIQKKTAKIWVNPQKNPDADEGLASLFHEILHVWAVDLLIAPDVWCGMSEGGLDQLSYVMVKAFKK